MASDAILKRIRKKYDVPAFHGVTVKTSVGEFGIIAGGEGQTLRVWFQSTKKSKYFNPDEVSYEPASVSITLRK